MSIVLQCSHLELEKFCHCSKHFATVFLKLPLEPVYVPGRLLQAPKRHCIITVVQHGGVFQSIMNIYSNEFVSSSNKTSFYQLYFSVNGAFFLD